MIVFHILYDLNYFNILSINLKLVYFLLLMYSIGTIFLLLVGISLYLSYLKSKDNLTKKQMKLKIFCRGLKIFGLGCLITIVTWIYPHEGFIIFGVLHCIGLSIILAYPFLRFNITNLMIGILLVYAGIYLKTLSFDFSWLLWLGFKPSEFYTIDYFPILPWFGIILIGISIGNIIYPDYKRNFDLLDISTFKIIRFLCLLGRYSLIIYFLHQPIIIAMLYILAWEYLVYKI